MAVVGDVPGPGAIIGGKYILGERIGEGGMGIVFLADQPSLGRTVAIKLLQPALATNDALVRRFHSEAVAACRVQHPGAVAVIDCGTADGGEVPFIAMEVVPGRLLSAIVDGEELSIVRALGIVGQLLRTLKVAHANGVIHADIKSDNIIVDEESDTTTLIDFGLAQIDGRSEPGELVSGTPEYMAPELIRGEQLGAPTDLYGVGVILYELLTGQTPFEGGPMDEVLRRQLAEEPVPPSALRPERGIPAELDQIVLRTLHKDPKARFASAGELARELAEVRRTLEGSGVGERREARVGGIAARISVRVPKANEIRTTPALPHLLHETPMKKAS